MNATATRELRWTIRASFDLRGAVKRQLRAFCWNNAFDIDIEEERGWFASMLLIRIVVPVSEAKHVEWAVSRWLEESRR
ncbi:MULTISPECIES: hypothetical protein [Nocardia]|uniref:hypothetical protein n=1 Tax=Nocardia TaxID=1817 RepID=UPI000D68609D|nr:MULTISPECIES: hypothetical protein [Nocardia]